MCFEVVAERQSLLHQIAIAAPFAPALQVAVGFELPEDALHGTLGDADLLGDVANARVGIMRDADQHVRVVREEGPAGRPIAHGGLN